jgi:hypothetical protein
VLEAAVAAAAASFLNHIPQPNSSIQMKVIKPPGVKWVVNLIQLKLGYSWDMLKTRAPDMFG